MAQFMDVTLVHFNDVYHISDSNHVARFASILADPRIVTGDVSTADQQLRIFSGDAFSPSLEASVLRGEHMPAVLNALNIDVACYGNHDFDFGEDRLAQLSKLTNFPWTLTNAFRKQSPSKFGQGDRLLALAQEYVIREVDGLRIGFIGLAGTDWPSNCRHLPDCDIRDPASIAEQMAKHLREQKGCGLVIALTHMRLAEDIAVSQSTKSGSGRIDLFLGGHDHTVVQWASTEDSHPSIVRQQVHPSDSSRLYTNGDLRIIKSGTDWNGLSIVRLKVAKHNEGKASILQTKVHQVTDLKNLLSYNKIPPCPRTQQVISNIQDKIAKMVEKPLVIAECALEGRSRIVRSQESNLGNMLADVVRAFYGTDIAFINSGAMRCDRVINPGQPLRIRDIVEISPFDNALVVKRVSGQVLAQALENSVSDAHTDGRFLQVSGVSMTVDWGCSEGQRIRDLIHLPKDSSPQKVQDRDMYTVTMVDFIALGYDGYSCFKGAEVLVSAEGAVTDTNLLLQVFETQGAENKVGGAQAAEGITEGVGRAQNAIVCRRHLVSGLPIVSPRLEGRIQVINNDKT